MFTTHKSVLGVAAAIAFGIFGAGCETAGLDKLPDVGLASAVKGKPAPEPDLKENPPLKMPPANAALPVPTESN